MVEAQGGAQVVDLQLAVAGHRGEDAQGDIGVARLPVVGFGDQGERLRQEGSHVKAELSVCRRRRLQREVG